MTAAHQESAGHGSAVRYSDPPMQNMMGLYLTEMRQVVNLPQQESAKLEAALIRGREASQSLSLATSSEERAYLQAAIAYGQLARECLIHAYLRVPVGLAKRHRRDHLDFLDLVQEGNLALVDAIDTYQPAADDSLFFHICRRIRVALWRLINTSDLVGRPIHIIQYRSRISVVVPLLRERLGRQPTVAEIAAEIGISERMARLALASAQPVWSLGQPLGASSNRLLGDVLAAADAIEDATDTPTISEVLLESVRAALETLTPLQRQVINLTFGFQDQKPRGFQAVSECLGHHDKRVASNLYHQAIDQLRRQLLNPAEYAAPSSSSTVIAARMNTAVLRRSKRKRSKATLTIRKNHYEALGRPSRVRVEADADGLQIVPDPEGRYEIEQRGQHIYLAINSIARRQRMRAGRYEAVVVDGGLHIGAYLD